MSGRATENSTIAHHVRFPPSGAESALSHTLFSVSTEDSMSATQQSFGDCWSNSGHNMLVILVFARRHWLTHAVVAARFSTESVSLLDHTDIGDVSAGRSRRDAEFHRELDSSALTNKLHCSVINFPCTAYTTYRWLCTSLLQTTN